MGSTNPLMLLYIWGDFQETYKSKNYKVNWYRKIHWLGLVQKFGQRKETIRFGGKACKDVSEEVFRSFAAECMKKLDAGESETNVQEWVRTAISRDIE